MSLTVQLTYLSKMKFIKPLIFALSLVLIAFLLEVRYYFVNGTINDTSDMIKMLNKVKHSADNLDIEYLMDTLEKLVQQRNNMSRMMNLKQQKLGQIECEVATIQKDRQKVSSSGGWCAQESVENSGKHKTDRKLVPVLATFLKDKCVASFGDGPGRYKQLFTDSGLLKEYDAYDGAPFSEETSEGRVLFLDLTLPQYGLPLYDWILSLEVAEHIPKEHESIYVDNIVRHAKEGVILSWANPGQGGFSHVNARPFVYVKAKFEKYGFIHDAEHSERFKNAASLKWFQSNINVFRRKFSNEIDRNKALLI